MFKSPRTKTRKGQLLTMRIATYGELMQHRSGCKPIEIGRSFYKREHQNERTSVTNNHARMCQICFENITALRKISTKMHSGENARRMNKR